MKTPKSMRRIPPSPIKQLRNVIDGVCEESIEAEVMSEEQAALEAEPKRVPEFREQGWALARRVDLTRFAIRYASKLATVRDDPPEIPKADPRPASPQDTSNADLSNVEAPPLKDALEK